MNKQEVLTKYRLKKEACNRWKQVQAIQEQCRNAVLVCRDGVRKAKAHLELILVRVKKVFYMCYQLGKTGKNISPLPNGTGALVASDAVRPRCSIFFAPVFTGKISLQEHQASETRGQVWSKKAYHWLRRSSIKDIKVYAQYAQVHGICWYMPRRAEEVPDITARILLIVLERS